MSGKPILPIQETPEFQTPQKVPGTGQGDDSPAPAMPGQGEEFLDPTMGMVQRHDGVAAEPQAGGYALGPEETDKPFFTGLLAPRGPSRPSSFSTLEEATADGRRRAQTQKQFRAQQELLAQTVSAQREMRASQELMAQMALEAAKTRTVSGVAADTSQQFHHLLAVTAGRERELQSELLRSQTEQIRSETLRGEQWNCKPLRPPGRCSQKSPGARG